MKTRYFFLLIAMLLTFLCQAQRSSYEVLQDHYQQLKVLTDENEVELLLNQLPLVVKKRHSLPLQIVQHVVLADISAKKADNMNEASTSHYIKALTLAENLSDRSYYFWVSTKFGFYYYSYAQYTLASPYFLKVEKALDQQPQDVLFNTGEIYQYAGYFFGTLKKHDKGITYLTKARTYFKPDSETYSGLLHATGLLYHEKGESEKAEALFLQSKDLALRYHYPMRYAKSLGQLALVYQQRKEWDRAEALLLEDIKLSEEHHGIRNLMWARIQLGKLYIDKNEFQNAQNTLVSAQSYAQSKPYLKGYEQEIEQLLLQLALAQGDEQAELQSRRKLDALHEIVSQTEGNEAIQQIIANSEQEKVKWQLEAEKSKLQKAVVVKWSVLALCVLLLLLFNIRLMYKRKLSWQQSRYESKLLSFQLDKVTSEQKLNASKKTLISYKNYLLEKQQQISDLEIAIEHLRKSSSAFLEKKQGNLQSLLQSHLMTDESWHVFKQAFIAEDPLFYTEITNRFPELTESNLRIVLLQKLGLNNIEMAHILGVTVDAIKKAKQRMRKKYPEDSDYLFQ